MKLQPDDVIERIKRAVPCTLPMEETAAVGVRLFTRNGHDWTGRFPLIARAALSLKAASCLRNEHIDEPGDSRVSSRLQARA